MKPHWYYIEYHECPICGRSSTYRERRYTPQPLDRNDRIYFEQVYDQCIEWQFY
jgi:hypothetical protein